MSFYGATILWTEGEHILEEDETVGDCHLAPHSTLFIDVL